MSRSSSSLSKGFEDIKDTVKRTEACEEGRGRHGDQSKGSSLAGSEYDIVAISNSSDEIALPRAFQLSTAKLGNAQSRTMRAFTAAEMEKILAKVA